MQINILEAKNHLSKLVQAVLDGEEVVIAKNGTPVVRLVKLTPPIKRKPGAWAHLMTEAEIDAAFSPEADAEIAQQFESSRIEPRSPVRRKSSPGKAGSPS